MSEQEYVSTQGAAEILGVTHTRVRQYIYDGRLPAQLFGNSYVIRREDVERIRGRKRGRGPQRTLPKS